LRPGFMIGGVPLNFPHTFAVGKGNHFIIEGDEYDTAFFDKVPKFVHYRPRSVILTSIEFDHADIYKDLAAVKEAFKMLLRLIPVNGHFVYNAEDENIESILGETKCSGLHSYGVKKGEWRLGEIRWGEEYSEFDVLFKGKKHDIVRTQLFGEYNLLNALAVYATGYNLGISQDKIKSGLAGFKGVKRRQEIIGRPNDITVIDDFAHHPTAVRVTIDGVRKRFKKGRIVAIFEPRSATARRKIFQDDFARALSTADHVIVSVPYDQSKIAPEERFDSEALIKRCQEFNPRATARVGHSIEEIIEMISASAHPGDVALLMSNGGFGGIYQKLLDQLS
jgi:UDP-N-acetylmuramate: L-alanyl-gamma-D-glutamyl-meso-diaminopimelate ligase